MDEKDMEASVATVRSLCEQIEADLILLRERTESGGKIRDYLIRRRVGEQDFLEVRYESLQISRNGVNDRNYCFIIVHEVRWSAFVQQWK